MGQHFGAAVCGALSGVGGAGHNHGVIGRGHAATKLAHGGGNIGAAYPADRWQPVIIAKRRRGAMGERVGFGGGSVDAFLIRRL